MRDQNAKRPTRKSAPHPTTETGEELSQRQSALLRALSAEPSIRLAAKAARVSEATAFRYLREPAFVAALHAARRDFVSHMTQRLHAASLASVDALTGIVSDENAKPGHRIAAARTILMGAFRANETAERDASLIDPRRSEIATTIAELTQEADRALRGEEVNTHPHEFDHL